MANARNAMDLIVKAYVSTKKTNNAADNVNARDRYKIEATE
jgi:hypothetical protein